MKRNNVYEMYVNIPASVSKQIVLRTALLITTIWRVTRTQETQAHKHSVTYPLWILISCTRHTQRHNEGQASRCNVDIFVAVGKTAILALGGGGWGVGSTAEAQNTNTHARSYTIDTTQ